MHSSPGDGLLPLHSAVQHDGVPRAPRPLPLFLELVREVGEQHPELGREALAGLRAYEQAERRPAREARAVVASVMGSCVRNHGGDGPPALLVPSLINPPRVLDLDAQVSLADAVARMGRRALLLDWGPAQARSNLDVAGHVEALLLALLREIGEPVALVGYCLGGTMALAAANFAPVERLVTIAAPWHFSAYPPEARSALDRLWGSSREAAKALGALPMEVLQAAFWSLEPKRTVAKFAEYARFDPASPEARRFVELEDWANEGEPLPYPTARELIDQLFGADASGRGEWRIGGRTISDALSAPILNVTAEHDRIAPAASAPAGERVGVPAGHVGMIVGSARARLHDALRSFLAPCR